MVHHSPDWSHFPPPDSDRGHQLAKHVGLLRQQMMPEPFIPDCYGKQGHQGTEMIPLVEEDNKIHRLDSARSSCWSWSPSPPPSQLSDGRIGDNVFQTGCWFMTTTHILLWAGEGEQADQSLGASFDFLGALMSPDIMYTRWNCIKMTENIFTFLNIVYKSSVSSL